MDPPFLARIGLLGIDFAGGRTTGTVSTTGGTTEVFLIADAFFFGASLGAGTSGTAATGGAERRFAFVRWDDCGVADADLGVGVACAEGTSAFLLTRRLPVGPVTDEACFCLMVFSGVGARAALRSGEVFAAFETSLLVLTGGADGIGFSELKTGLATGFLGAGLDAGEVMVFDPGFAGASRGASFAGVSLAVALLGAAFAGAGLGWRRVVVAPFAELPDLVFLGFIRTWGLRQRCQPPKMEDRTPLRVVQSVSWLRK